MKSGLMMLTGIIPGRNEPKIMDPYIDLIVDDTTALNSMTVYDARCSEYFQLKANILLHLLDYPGQNKMFKSQGKALHITFLFSAHFKLSNPSLGFHPGGRVQSPHLSPPPKKKKNKKKKKKIEKRKKR